MVQLNRFLSVLILIFSLSAGVHGWLLFNARNDLRGHGDKMADAVSEAVKELDSRSGTDLQGNVHRKEIISSDGKPMPGGTLGWEFYNDTRDPATKTNQKFEGYLEQFKNQVRVVREQRDNLAASIGQISGLFELGDENTEILQKLNSYEDALTQIYEGLEKIKIRDDKIFSKIENAADKVGFPLEKNVLTDIETFEEPLQNLANHISKMNDRAINYADAIAQAVTKIDAHDFEVDESSLKDSSKYVVALTAILNDFDNINDKLKNYEKCKIEFIETKENLGRTVEALESADENYAAIQSKLASVENNYDALRKKYNVLVSEASGTQTTQLKGVEGKIINVNYDWNYVIINLGKKDNLPENLEMIVARDQEYICKVLVTRVFSNYSVAEILPKVKHGTAVEGDRVIF